MEGYGSLEARSSSGKAGSGDTPPELEQTDSKLGRGQSKDKCGTHPYLWVTRPPAQAKFPRQIPLPKQKPGGPER